MTYGLSATGITGIQKVAGLLADFGRYEDGYFVHAAEGETVVPLAVLDKNPRLKEALFTQMREMGLSPERYIVGNELNSRNPITGQPEFFLGKIGRGIGRALKAAVPIVLPAVLSTTPLGKILGPTAGIGITRLIQGKGLERIASDIFKTAGITTLLSGLTARHGSGGVLGDLNIKKRGGAFLSGLSKGRFFDPTIFGTRSGALAPVEDRSITPTEDLREALAEDDARTSLYPGFNITGPTFQALGPPKSALARAHDQMMNIPGGPYGTGGQLLPNYLEGKTLSGGYTPNEAVTQMLANKAQVPAISSGANALSTAAAGIEQTPGFFSSLSQGRFRDAFLPKDITAIDILKEYPNLSVAQAEALAADASPGVVRKYLPLTGLGLGVAGLAGAFDRPDEPEPVSVDELETQLGPTSSGLVAANPRRYRTGIPSYSPVDLASINIPTAYGADGGSVGFPRRIGAIAGPGTGTSDDVPAMLSDGEYVMTADAVRGAGNGNREQGMRNMYNIMRQFERQVV